MAAISDTGAKCWNPLDLLDRARAGSPRSALALLEDELTRAGFGQGFYCCGVPRASTQPLLHRVERGAFRGAGLFVDTVFSEVAKRPELLATDPVAAHCKRSLTPYVWSRGKLKANEDSAFSLASDLGISSFLAFPLRNADASLYGNFTVYCSDPSYRSWFQHAKRLAPLLHITAQYFQDSFYGCGAPAGGPSEFALSPRQRECLLWASRGLSTKQIAERLKLSEPVVHEYLSGAKRRLGCATRVQAVARAVRLDLIEP